MNTNPTRRRSLIGRRKPMGAAYILPKIQRWLNRTSMFMAVVSRVQMLLSIWAMK